MSLQELMTHKQIGEIIYFATKLGELKERSRITQFEEDMLALQHEINISEYLPLRAKTDLIDEIDAYL